MQGSFKVSTIVGIEIRLHYTWLLALLLIAWSLSSGYFPMAGESPVADWVLGILAALLLFISVLLHELGHSLVATLRGIRVDSITLFIFGGVSNITREPTTAKDEFLIAVVGPLTSLALAGVFWAIGLLLPSASAASAVAGYVASANLLLGLFNIVPGFPLDGGRVFRSIVWAVTGNMVRATRIASYVGQAIAFLLIGWGLLRVVAGDFAGGLWIGFIGWFLNSGAEASRLEVTVQNTLAKVHVSSIMNGLPESLSPDLSVRDFVLEHALQRGQRALPVIDAGHLVGHLTPGSPK
jgi:Zn-dependent protease